MFKYKYVYEDSQALKDLIKSLQTLLEQK